jgi:hypothetical protein
MLDTLDILIGFTLIMLIVSLPVTLLTAAVSDVLNLRGAALHKGVVSLIGLLDDEGKVSADQRDAAADAILRDELVARRGIGGRRRRAGTVHREELSKLLIAFGSVRKPDDSIAAQKALQELIETLGIKNPAATLKAVRDAQLTLEKEAPNLAHDVRVTQAMLDHASSDFLARMNGWFDQQMDRVEELFILYARMATGVVALAVALLLQLDAIALVNRLADDKTVRNALVEMAVADPARFDPAPDAVLKRAADEETEAKAAHDKAKAGTDQAAIDAAQARLTAAGDARQSLENRQQARAQLADASKAVVDAKERAEADPASKELAAAYADALARQAQARETLSDLAATADDFARSLTANPDIDALVGFELVRVPKTWNDWHARMTADDLFGRLLGILIAAALLSMGGPFWYGLLQNLIKLRSTLTRKEQEQREIRQTTQPRPEHPATP